MDAATLSLITAIIGLLIKFLPDMETLGQEIVTLFNSGSALSADDLAKIQAFTDQLVARGRDLEAKILSDAASAGTEAPKAETTEPAATTSAAS